MAEGARDATAGGSFQRRSAAFFLKSSAVIWIPYMHVRMPSDVRSVCFACAHATMERACKGAYLRLLRLHLLLWLVHLLRVLRRLRL